MPRRHSPIWLHVSIARIRKNVWRADGAGTAKGWLKHLRVARHWKRRKSFSRRAGKRVKCIGFAILSVDVVKERTELSSAQFNSSIGNDLDQALQIKLSSNRDA